MKLKTDNDEKSFSKLNKEAKIPNNNDDHQTANQPRSHALPSCGGKTLAGAGHVTRGNLIASGEEGKVSNYMLPLPQFTLQLQGVRVLCTINFENHIKFKHLLNLVPVCF
jgi:hypothetical protein